MSTLWVNRQEMSVQELLRSERTLQLNPGYQREGGIWTKDRQQLFIDSILNRFDIPAIYLHRLRPPQFLEDRAASYAVVDGRQRLEALRAFYVDELRLSSDFTLLEDDVQDAQDALSEELKPGSSRYSGKTLSELRSFSPELYYRFLKYGIPVSVIETENTELIEELFFRLNEGVPLTPAEKRSRGVLLREYILPLVGEEDLFRSARFRSRRRTYEDLLIRLLYLQSENATIEAVPDLRKKAIDDFAASFRPRLGVSWSPQQEQEARERLEHLLGQVRPVLESINATFEENDRLLSTMNLFLVHYLVVQRYLSQEEILPSREVFETFSLKLNSLRGVAEDQLTEDAAEALEFADPIQGSTTGSYYRRRALILWRYLHGELQIGFAAH